MLHTVTQKWEVDVEHKDGTELPQGDPFFVGLLESAIEMSIVGNEEGTLSLIEDNDLKWWSEEVYVGCFVHATYTYSAFRVS